MSKPTSVLHALELAEKSEYEFDWNSYTKDEFTIQLGLRKKHCLDYVKHGEKNNGVDVYCLTQLGKKYLSDFRNKVELDHKTNQISRGRKRHLGLMKKLKNGFMIIFQSI